MEEKQQLLVLVLDALEAADSRADREAVVVTLLSAAHETCERNAAAERDLCLRMAVAVLGVQPAMALRAALAVGAR